MSQCAECNEPIVEGDKIMEVPCCDLKYHSACAITRFCSGLYSSSLFCSCGAVLHQHAYSVSDEVDTATRVSEVMAKEGVPAEVKAINKKKAAARKACAAYRKLLAVKKREFKDIVGSQIEALKAAKQNAIDEVKASAEYKAYRNSIATVSLADSAFRKKHEIRWRDMRAIFGSTSWYKRLWSPMRFMKYSFRIRL